MQGPLLYAVALTAGSNDVAAQLQATADLALQNASAVAGDLRGAALATGLASAGARQGEQHFLNDMHPRGIVLQSDKTG